ncbi:MAG TPA: hypothetical protein GX509_02320 [Firmicutes bacterium]|nr:hypothetical protein [Bacillota bacterium]
MRKLTVALVALLTCAIALPAVAAPKVDVTGSLDTSIKLDPNVNGESKVFGESDLRLNLGIGLGAGDAIKAVIEFAPIKWAPLGAITDENNQTLNNDKPLGSDVTVNPGTLGKLTPAQILGPENGLTIDKAYLETAGAYWPGGPQVVTRLGDLAVDYSPYVAAKSATDGVIEGAQMTGMPIGPVTISGFYGWAPDNPDDPVSNTIVVRGASAGASIQGVDLSGSMVKAGENLSYVGQAAFSPMQNMTITGTYAADEAHSAAARKVEGTITGLPVLSGVTVKAGYRDFDWAFDPKYRDRSEDDDGNWINVVDQNRGQRGFNAEVSTALHGVNLTGSIDQHEQREDANVIGQRRIFTVGADTELRGFKLSGAYKLTTSNVIWTNGDNAQNYGGLEEGQKAEAPEVTTIELGAERTFPVGMLAIDAKYGLTLNSNEPAIHDVQASTVLPVPVLNAVEVSGKARLNGEQLSYVAGAGYVAPNGIKFAVNYSNGYEVGDDSYEAGLSASADLKVEF